MSFHCEASSPCTDIQTIYEFEQTNCTDGSIVTVPKNVNESLLFSQPPVSILTVIVNQCLNFAYTTCIDQTFQSKIFEDEICQTSTFSYVKTTAYFFYLHCFFFLESHIIEKLKNI